MATKPRRPVNHQIGKAALAFLGAFAFSFPVLAQQLPAAKKTNETISPASPMEQGAHPLKARPVASLFAPMIELELMTGSQPNALALDARDGAIWFSAPALGALGRIDPETQKITYTYLGKRTKPWGIAFGPDHSLYSTDKTLNVLHRVDGVSGEITRITMPSDLPLLDLSGLRADAAGRIWFAGAAGWLGKFNPHNGQTDVSSHDDLPGLALGALADDGTIWFVSGRAARMIRIDPARKRFDSTTLPDGFKAARGISAGRNGEVWVSSGKSNAIARFAGRGTWKVSTLPWPESQPQAILVRRDGSVMIADTGRRMLVRYLPELDLFEEVAALGDGGAVKSMIETRTGIAYADAGGDDIRLFNDIPPSQN